MSEHDLSRMDRREAIKWMVTATASVSLLNEQTFGAEAVTGAAPVTAKPYGTDPLLNKTYKPGDFWPLTLSTEQRRTVTALCDFIIPADDVSPSASTVKVPDFIDEWVSAPYPLQQENRVTILEGLAWLEQESQKRFQKDFASLSLEQQSQIGDDICWLPKAKPEFQKAATFFSLYRNLTAGGFYSTPQGMKDIGYRGNVPLAKFEGPPKEILQKLGLE